MRLILILNDQGGAVLRCEEGQISPTLRAQDHGHPPVVILKENESIRNRHT